MIEYITLIANKIGVEKVIIDHQAEASVWATRNFERIKLGDERRTKRAIKIAEAMAVRPGASIPQLFSNTYDVKAAYNLFKNAEVNPDNLQSGHRDLTLAEINKPGVYLLLEDTTELSWSGNEPIPGLGPIGDGRKGLQGVHLHSVLAVSWSREEISENSRPAVEILGFCDQQYYIRKARPKQEKKKNNSQQGKKRARESQLWEKATQRIGKAPAQSEIEWIRVCDRGADIYELLYSCQEDNHHFVVRAKQDRALLAPETGQLSGRLFDIVKQQAALGSFALELRSRPGQVARTAHLSVSAVAVQIRAPWRPGKSPGKNPPINCTAVRVWESAPPAGIKPLEWVLLCDKQITNFTEALQCALIYCARWIIEEFHKALKTAMGAERLQLETAEALFAAIAIMSVVALRLISLREQVRLQVDAPAEASGLTETELKVLNLKLNKPIETVKDVALAIARLGGHLNRKSDGMPGWQSLWRGMLSLQSLVEGFRLAHNI
jgi:hypothetical protein